MENGFCGNNIIALRPGFTVSSLFLDVSAHYDGGYHNDDSFGAKDNASGVVSVLEIARSMANVPTQHAVRFVFFAAEEVAQDAPGSLGFLRSPNGAQDRTVAGLNFDTTGTPDNGIAVWYRGRAAFELGQLMAKQNSLYGLGLSVLPADISNEPNPNFRVQSDERSYAKEGLPAVTSLGGGWQRTSDFHTSFDRPEYVDFNNVFKIARINLATLLALDASARF